MKEEQDWKERGFEEVPCNEVPNTKARGEGTNTYGWWGGVGWGGRTGVSHEYQAKHPGLCGEGRGSL